MFTLTNGQSCPLYTDGLFATTTSHPRYIVTGGAGFIGSSLIKVLSKSVGSGQIKVIDNLIRGQIPSLQFPEGHWPIDVRADLCAADLRNRTQVIQLIRNADYIFHIANGHDHSDNRLMARNVADACEQNGVRNIIHVQTACKLGNMEDLPIHGVCKSDVDVLEVNRTIVNLGSILFNNVYGPWRGLPSASKPDAAEWSGQKQSLNLIFIDDAVQALLLVKDKGMNQGLLVVEPADTTQSKRMLCTSMPLQKPGTELPCIGWIESTGLDVGLRKTYEQLPHHIKTRTLVITIAQPRGGLYAWRSLQLHLLKPFNAHLATYFTPSPRTLLHNISLFEWTVPEHEDWGVVFQDATSRCNNLVGQRMGLQAVCNFTTRRSSRHQIWIGGVKACKQRASSGILLAFRWLVSQKLLELYLLQQYDYFVLTRSDYVYLCDHVNPTNLPAGAVWVPHGEEFKGYTDRHLVASGPLFLRALNVTQELVCHPDQSLAIVRARNVKLNLELFLKRMWTSFGLRVGKFHPSMFTVKLSTDKYQWSAGENPRTTPSHIILSQHGLLVKYHGELIKAMDHCNKGSLRPEMVLNTKLRILNASGFG